MARAYSQDLRDRVISMTETGRSARQAASLFGVGIATAIRWAARLHATGERTARKQGAPPRSKLSPHRDFILALINETPDATIHEIQTRLRDERSIHASVGAIWQFLDRAGLTYKKRPPTPSNGIAKT